MEVKAIINGKEEILHGTEALIYVNQGEKAVLNRRKYCQDNYDYIVSLEKYNYVNKFTPRNDNENVTYPTLNYENDNPKTINCKKIC